MDKIELLSTTKIELVMENAIFRYEYERKKFESILSTVVKEVNGGKGFRIIFRHYKVMDTLEMPQYENCRYIYKIEITRNPEAIEEKDFWSSVDEFIKRVLDVYALDSLYITAFTPNGVFYKEC